MTPVKETSKVKAKQVTFLESSWHNTLTHQSCSAGWRNEGVASCVWPNGGGDEGVATLGARTRVPSFHSPVTWDCSFLVSVPTSRMKRMMMLISQGYHDE